MPNIIAECSGNGITEVEGVEIAELIKSTIRDLNIIKQVPQTTRQYIKEQLPILKHPKDLIFEVWLTTALGEDELFIYAYNALAQKQNRVTGQVFFPVRSVVPDFFKQKESLEAEVTSPERLPSVYDADKLNKIFNRLQARKIVRSGDRENFLALFTDKFIDKVYWNEKIHGAQAGLFDLMQRITGENITLEMLKPRFRAYNKPIHGQWKNKIDKPTKFIDKIMKEI